MFYSDVNWNGRSDDDEIKWHSDGETAPLGGGPVDPIGDIDNPND